jgi:hypothetical protein
MQLLYNRPIELLLRFGTEENTLRLRPKNLYRICSSQSVQVLRDFVQLVLVLDQFCTVAQLFPPRVRATFKRKLKYENEHTIVYPEILPVAGSKGLP